MSEHDHSQHPQLERLRQARSAETSAEKQRERPQEKDRGMVASGASFTTRAALASIRGHSVTKLARRSFGFER